MTNYRLAPANVGVLEQENGEQVPLKVSSGM